MSARTTIVRPGILVTLNSRISGGVSYSRIDLDTGKTMEELKAEAERTGTKVKAVTRWETTKTVDDPEERAAAEKARALARSAISRCCEHTAFGMLCPTANEALLDAGILAAEEIVRAHNEVFGTTTRVSVYALKGRIAGTDEQAARAITREMSDLITEMNAGIDRLDPEAIRDAADRAAKLGAMLEEEAGAKATAAIKAARSAARTITARVEKKGEDGAIVLMDVQRGAIEMARVAFLDFSAPLESAEAGERLPAVSLQRVAELDLGDDLVPPVEEPETPQAPPRALDLTPGLGLDDGFPRGGPGGYQAPARAIDFTPSVTTPGERVRRKRSEMRKGQVA